MSEIKPSYPIIEAIVPSGCHGKLGKGQPSYIVIHETAGPGAPAVNLYTWWKNGGGLPVHYALDWNGVCYHCVPDDTLAWHVGGGNAYTIGIELCHATNQKDFDKVWKYGVEWAAWQLSKRGWGVDRMLSHYECGMKWGGTDHTDPIGYFNAFGKSWNHFKKDVKKRLEEGASEVNDADIERIKTAVTSTVPEATWNYVLTGKKASTRLKDASDQLTSKTDPSGRNVKMNIHDHQKWMAKMEAEMNARQEKMDAKLDRILEILGEEEYDKLA